MTEKLNEDWLVEEIARIKNGDAKLMIPEILVLFRNVLRVHGYNRANQEIAKKK